MSGEDWGDGFFEELEKQETAMGKITGDAKGIIGERQGGDPENELDNFYQCKACGQSVDKRDLGQVFHHEENGHEPIDFDSQPSVEEIDVELSSDVKITAARTNALEKLMEAERAWRDYFSKCELGDERIHAAEVFERIRIAARVG